MEVRHLVAVDAAEFQALRLRALREHPEAYGSSVEEEQALPLEDIATRLGDGSGNSVQFGAFDANILVGMVGLHRMARSKTRHKAYIGNMYVAPEVRARGIGRALIDAALRHARGMDGLEDVSLAVTVGNRAARALYISAGFVPYCVEQRYIIIGDSVYDIEWLRLDLRAV